MVSELARNARVTRSLSFSTGSLRCVVVGVTDFYAGSPGCVVVEMTVISLLVPPGCVVVEVTGRFLCWFPLVVLW